MPPHRSLRKCHLLPINSLTLNKGNWLHMDLITMALVGKLGVCRLKGEEERVVYKSRWCLSFTLQNLIYSLMFLLISGLFINSYHSREASFSIPKYHCCSGSTPTGTSLHPTLVLTFILLKEEYITDNIIDYLDFEVTLLLRKWLIYYIFSFCLKYLSV